MTEKTLPVMSRLLGRLLFALPVLSLGLALVAWLRYGFDMPWFDDWRGYLDGSIHSLELGHLFRPLNDTLSPVGFTLDALAQRYLDGNSVAYQFLSMAVVLGSLLVLQWKLLLRALDSKLHASICFSLAVLMLQPGSYWGLENLAYYQALPLVFILWALWLLTGPGQPAWRGPAVAGLALLAGFTYISGAFAAFGAGLALLAVVRLSSDGVERKKRLLDAAWFTAAAGVAVAAQFYFSVLKFQGTHAGIPLAYPIQLQFWAFYLGKLGRSLLLPQSWPWTSLVITVAVSLGSAAVALLVLRRSMSQEATQRDQRLATVFIPIAAGVFVYLMLVAAGRTNFRPDDMNKLIEIFALGFTRFHFFWAALLWPWVAAAVLVLGQRKKWPRQAFDLGAAALGLVLVALALWGGGFDHMAVQKETAAARMPVTRCLLNELQRGGEVRCGGLVPARFEDLAPDAYPAYAYAKKMNASFVRYFPLIAGGKRRESIPAFYRFDGKTGKPLMHELQALGGGVFRATGPDPQLHLQTQQPQVTRQCSTMDVDVEIRVAAKDTAQLFFVPAGDSEVYDEKNSFRVMVGVDPGVFQTLSFRMESDSGFFESVRFDPVTTQQDFDIREIRLYCVRERL
jgi:hypothetical protein